MLVEAVLEPSLGEKPAYVVLPFDAKAVFGRVRAPVVVSVGAYRFATVIAAERGRQVLRISREHREAAGAREGEVVRLELELDEAPRPVEVPPDVGGLLVDRRLADAWAAFPLPQQKRLLAYVGEVKGAEARRSRLEHLRERLEEGAAARERQKSALLARPKPLASGPLAPGAGKALPKVAAKLGATKPSAPAPKAVASSKPEVSSRASNSGASKAAAPSKAAGPKAAARAPGRASGAGSRA